MRSHGGALPVADSKDCQAAQVKGVFSVWSWRISWLMRVVLPMPGNPTIEMAVMSELTIVVFKISISLVRCTQFLTGGKFSGRGKVRSVWLSREISAIAATKSGSVLIFL